MRTAMLDGAPVPYSVHVPSSYDPAVAVPLVSLFHGQGDTGENILSFFRTAAEANGFIALATSSTGAMGGWNPSVDVPRYDAALTDALAAYNVEQTRLYVWGFSAGGHLAHGIGLANSETFAAYGVNAGVLAAFAGATGPGRATRRIPVAIRIGTTDPLLPQARMDRGAFTGAGWVEGDDLDYQEFAGGHTVLPGHPQEMWTFFERWVAP
jgi:poly(3-hydroxybutyrate) depolymerase